MTSDLDLYLQGRPWICNRYRRNIIPLTNVDPRVFAIWIPVDTSHLQIGCNGSLSRYIKLRVAHSPGMPGTFSPPLRVSDPDMHHGMSVMHVPWCMPGSLTSGFLWSQWRGKRSRHSRCMRNPQFHVSGKRPIGWSLLYPIFKPLFVTWLNHRVYEAVSRIY